MPLGHAFSYNISKLETDEQSRNQPTRLQNQTISYSIGTIQYHSNSRHYIQKHELIENDNYNIDNNRATVLWITL